jgi:membrane protease YdiL (CAAX protease family)
LTEPSTPEDRTLPTEPATPTEPTTLADPSPQTAATPGLTTFSIEGRRAPALFVVGWLAIVAGVGLLAITMLGGGAGLAGALVSAAAFGALAIGLVLLAGSQTLERKAAGATYAGPSPLVVFLAVIATSRLAGYVVGLPLAAVGAAVPVEVGDLLAIVVQAIVFLGIVRLIVVGPRALTWTEMGLARSGNVVRELLGGAVFAGPVILITAVLGVLLVQVFGVVPPSPLPPTGTPSGLALHLLGGALIAPFYEEVLFRGFALTAWLRTVGPRAAIARSSVLFVLAHVLFVGGDSFSEAVSLAVVGGVVRVPIAVALGWLYIRTGSLWGPIGLHAAYNGILIVIGETGAGQ